MNWPERMNTVISYIEDNLEGEIDYTEAARLGGYSLTHFQRMFFAVFEVTPSEYTRLRRLTLAARELMTGRDKVIDIALRYGYDSPEAFTRAFRNVHGINPQAARTSGAKLTAFPRISFSIELKGGNLMEYQIIEKPAFDIIGRGKQFGVANGEFKEHGRTFWKNYVDSEEYKALWGLTGGKPGPVTGTYVMSFYLPNEKGTLDPFINVFGIEKTGEKVTKNFEVFHIPAATYAEFHCNFNSNAAVNKKIYSEWFPATGYERDNATDIALFSQVPFTSEVFVRWWIPVVKKKK